MKFKGIGIDDVKVHIPNVSLSLTKTYAEAKNQDPKKFSKGLGVKRSTLPDTYEDPATMGANAALKLIEENEGVEPEKIQRIAVATESSWDRSKPISTYIAGMLEDKLGEGCLDQAGKTEHKFACIAGTQALNDTVNELAMEFGEDDYGLVIATDTAWYEKGSSGEPTQGAGAVAMLVTKNPRLVDLSVGRGRMGTDETDFLKPEQQYPNVAGKRSMNVYLVHMKGALDNFQGAIGEKVNPDDLNYTAFHIPFPKMAEKAAPLGFRNLARGTEKEEEIIDQVGEQPSREDYDTAEEFLEAEKEFEKALSKSSTYQDFYERSVKPTLRISRNTGNWYTGSVHLARVSSLLDAKMNGLDDGLMMLGSYGSGAQAEIHAEKIQPGYRDVLRFSIEDMENRIKNTYDLGWSEYQELHDHHNHAKSFSTERFTEPSGEFVFSDIGEMGERLYEYVE